MHHQGGRTLSDHIPICITLILKKERTSEQQHISYFKMDSKYKKNAEMLAEVAEVWCQHPSWALDDRKKWGLVALALGRVGSLKAKHIHEALNIRQLDNGQIVTNEDELFEVIQDNFRTLIQEDPESDAVRAEHREVLQLIDRHLTEEQNHQLEELPSNKLKEDIVRSLPSDKAPGLDRVTAEILVAGGLHVPRLYQDDL
ncbi:hypothetical protein R1flu_014079 [Riccia fluitans]|uniref:Uncharacterized protein n=1 Tax=Riccia fluitans TaxID=41844 RepID=A0ABD1YFF5_9MARC